MPITQPDGYLCGFGNELLSEAPGYEGAIPDGLTNPQRCNYSLKAEQISGSAFTAPRASNQRSWLYRKRPSVMHRSFVSYQSSSKDVAGNSIKSYLSFAGGVTDPNQRRWTPFKSELLDKCHQVDFIDGLHTVAYSDETGCAASSVAIHVYLANHFRANRSFVNADGDFLIVPQEGSLLLVTEFGHLFVEPNEIAVVPQGIKFTVQFDDKIRGYILEVRGNHFELPYLGPIGANGLANPRDFQAPKARLDWSSSCQESWQIIHKFQNRLFETNTVGTPFDVAAWFGNYVPYKYNLNKFVSLNSVSVDHPDPSIFTVLTCQSHGRPGTAIADFVIFPPRWECAAGTFRPPYYHRNTMTEFMGLIKGQYQAKSAKFAPGGASLHHCMTAHGPDADCYSRASQEDTSQPRRVADGTMAFMFETSLSLKLTSWAAEHNVDPDYHDCWLAIAD